MNKSSTITGVLGLFIGLVVGTFFLATDNSNDAPADTAQTAETEDAPVQWKMASSFASTLIVAGTSGKYVEERVRTLSDGNMELRYFDPGALVPALEIFDAVSAGAVNAGWTNSGYWAGKIPALQFFAAVPFGARAGESLAWMYHGGGLELMQEIYARHNIYSMPCQISAPEGSGWFRYEITSLGELKGLKMRFFGLGAKVMERLGVSTQLIAPGDIFPALELGTIDAAELSFPALDLDLGFYEVAKHYYFPGWHQPTTFGELMINLDDWNSISPRQQALLQSICKESITRTLAESEAIQFKALQELESKGVVLHRWNPEVLAAFETAWKEVVAEEAANDIDFSRVWDSLRTFRENYKLWGDLGYIN